MHYPVCEFCDFGIMGYDDYGPTLIMNLSEDRHDLLAGLGVDPDGILLWVSYEVLNALWIEEHADIFRNLKLTILLLGVIFVLVTIAQLIKTGPIGWICAVLGFLSGYIITNNSFWGIILLVAGAFLAKFAES